MIPAWLAASQDDLCSMRIEHILSSLLGRGCGTVMEPSVCKGSKLRPVSEAGP